MIKTTGFSLAILFSALAFLTACGGGGGGGGSSTPVVEEPVEPELSCEELAATATISDLQGKSGTYDREYWTEQARLSIEQPIVDSAYLYSVVPDVDQCIEGVLTDAAKQDVLTFINQVRSLHGLSPMEYNSDYDAAAAQAALYVRSALGTAEMQCSEPENTFDAFVYIDAHNRNYVWFAEKDPVSINPVAMMALGLRSVVIPDWDLNGLTIAPEPPLDATYNYRSLLTPELLYTAYGQTGVSAAVIYDNAATQNTVDPEIDFVAIPYGHYPYLLKTVRWNTAMDWWLLQMVGDSDFGFDNVTGCLKNTNNDEYTEVSLSTIEGSPSSAVWSVPTETIVPDVTYEMSIYGIETGDGATHNIRYPVTIDYSSIAYIDGPLEEGDQDLRGSLDSFEDVDTYRITLSGDVVIQDVSEESYYVIEVAVFSPDGELIDLSYPLTGSGMDGAIQLNGLASGEYAIRLSNCSAYLNCAGQQRTAEYKLEVVQ